MYYLQTYKTKWHDTTPDGILRPSALLMYMQETANLQCRDWGTDLDRLHREEGLGFLLSRLMLRADEPIYAYEDIEVRTWCGESRGLTFVRCFSVHKEGRVVATALSHWALMDICEQKLVRVSAFDRPFPMGDVPDESTLPRKVRIPVAMDMETVGKRRIVYSDLDFNRHMNNTKYPDMVCDFLPDMTGKWVRTLSLSYLREAAFGDTLTVTRTLSGTPALPDIPETYLVRTTRSDGVVNLEAEVGLASL